MANHFSDCNPLNCACDSKRYRLVLAIGLAILFFEVVGGWLSGSLALLSDAGHVLADILAIFSAMVVDHQVRRHKNENKWRGGGAVFQGGLLCLIAVWLSTEAVGRWKEDYKIAGTLMLSVAILGAMGNYLQHLILGGDEKHITNRGIDWHVLSDLWQSFAVIAATLIISVTDWLVADLLISLAIAVVMAVWGVILTAKGLILWRS